MACRQTGWIGPMGVEAALQGQGLGTSLMEEGVEAAFTDIAADAGADWSSLRAAMLADGRYHVETY